MKKTYLNVGLSTLLVSSFFVGCGSSSSSTNTVNPNSITVEDGPVIGATVKDTAGQIATENGSNIYTFTNDITYPVTVTGGFVDVDGDGEFNDGDVKLTIPLRAAKGTVVTPVTTYLADNPTVDEDQLKSDWGVDDLYVLPSEDKKIYKASEHFVGQMFTGTPLVGIDISGIDLTVDDSLTPEEFAKQQEAVHKQQLITDGHATPFVENGFELAIGHVNDTHSHLESETMDLMFNDVETRTVVGGFSRVVTKLNEIKENNDNVLILNAGDTFQGTLYYSLFKGEADSAMFNMVEWDAYSLGNHEFDDGDQQLADYLDMLNIDSSKVLAANITAPSGNPLENKWTNYTIKTFDNGEKVGVIGIDIAGKTKNSSNPSDEILFDDEVTTAQTYIDELKSEGIDKIVLLTHVGLDNDKSYASQLDGVDVIIGGDSHSLMGDFSSVGLTSHDNSYPFETTDLQGKKVCIAQAWQYSYIVGNLNVIFDENGDVKHCNGTPTLLVGEDYLQENSEGNRVAVSDDIKSEIELAIAQNSNLEIVTEDSQTVENLTTYSDQVETQKATVIGSASEYLGHNRIPGQVYNSVELELGSNIAPIVAKSFYDLSNLADACIQNAGGVRISVDEGEITMDTAYTLLPFSNTLFEIKMTGAEIKQVLEDAVEEALYGGEDGEVSTGAFPYSYALKYDVDANADINNRILNLEMKDRETSSWSTLDLADTETMYTIVTNSYIAAGRDGYTTFATVQEEEGREGTDTYLDYAMSFVRYVEAKETAGESVTKLPEEDHPIKSYNGISLEKLGSYDTEKEGGSEIVAFDSVTKQMYVTNGEDKTLDIISISDVKVPTLVKSIDITEYGTNLNSVAVSNGKVAVAVEDGNDTVGKKQLEGKVVIFDTAGNHERTVTVGYLPDMVTFNEDGTKVIVANEGEPSDDYTIDPVGSIGVVTVANGNYVDIDLGSATLTNASDGTAVRLGDTPSNDQAKDLEPEYITVLDNYAYVTLQENNALVKVNLEDNTITFVKSFGAKSYDSESGNTIDIEENEEIEMKNFSELYGLYQPDSIASYKVESTGYLVTANEGDGREYIYESDATNEASCDTQDGDWDSDDNICEVTSHIDEKKISKLDLASSIALEYADDNDLKVMTDLGKNASDEYEKLYTYGARSFSIWDTNGDLVYDSGDDISKKVAFYQAELFNQDEGEMDGRSGNKGAEPEALTIGVIDEDTTYAFVGLERQNAIMVYDISDPSNVMFKSYLSTEEDDISPEGMKFIPASESPTGTNLLLVSFEVSGTTTIYEVK